VILAALGVSTNHVGYALLVLLVGGEAMGLLLPGETALIAAAAIAHGGGLRLSVVIPLAAVAAIVGDNIGYALGRSGARSLLLMAGPLAARRADLLARGEKFFVRYGRKAVFFGRWIPILRVTAAWLAGASRMPWPTFTLWNAAGCISWATSIGLAGYALGAAAAGALTTVVFVSLTLFAVVTVVRTRRRRRGRGDPPRGNERRPPRHGAERS
jgi:membrane protein DedA with SNARE-associated domain